MTAESVSVIVPAFNEASRIQRCLEPIVAVCRRRGWEALVVDDGSTDDTGARARSLGVVVVRHPTSRGVAAARNAGAGRARGDILVFVDADVVVPEQSLETLVLRILRDDTVHAVGAWPELSDLSPGWGARFVGLRAAMPFKEGPRRDIVGFSAFQSECGAIRRDAFDAVGGFPARHRGVGMEEFEMGHRLERLGYRNVILADAHYYHHFKSLGPRCRELFRRTRRWVPLLMARGRLESTGAVGTRSEALSVALTLVAWTGVAAAPWHRGGLVLSAGALFSQLMVERRFLALALDTYGPAMVLFSFPALQSIHLAVAAGFVTGLLDEVGGAVRGVRRTPRSDRSAPRRS